MTKQLFAALALGALIVSALVGCDPKPSEPDVTSKPDATTAEHVKPNDASGANPIGAVVRSAPEPAKTEPTKAEPPKTDTATTDKTKDAPKTP